MIVFTADGLTTILWTCPYQDMALCFFNRDMIIRHLQEHDKKLHRRIRNFFGVTDDELRILGGDKTVSSFFKKKR